LFLKVCLNIVHKFLQCDDAQQLFVQTTAWPNSGNKRFAFQFMPSAFASLRARSSLKFGRMTAGAGWNWTTFSDCDILAGWKCRRFSNRFLPLPGKRNAECGLPSWPSF
jgi:hypothetical protein